MQGLRSHITGRLKGSLVSQWRRIRQRVPSLADKNFAGTAGSALPAAVGCPCTGEEASDGHNACCARPRGSARQQLGAPGYGEKSPAAYEGTERNKKRVALPGWPAGK